MLTKPHKNDVEGRKKASYNTVKTQKLICKSDDDAARRAIDSVMFLTPETERDIDLALGIGTMNLDPEEAVEVVEVVVEDKAVDLSEDGPTAADLAKIEAEAA